MAVERRLKHGWSSETRTMLTTESLADASDWASQDNAIQLNVASNYLADKSQWETESGASWTSTTGAPIVSSGGQADGGFSGGFAPFPSSLDHKVEQDYYRQPLSSIAEAGPAWLHEINQTHVDHSLDALHQPTLFPDSSHQQYQAFTPAESFPPLSGPFYSSCPASLHTSPAPSHLVLDGIRQFATPAIVSNQRHNVRHLSVNTDIPSIPTRIAAPAAVNPFAMPALSSGHDTQYKLSSMSPLTPGFSRSNVSPHTFTPLPYDPQYILSSASTTPSDGMSREGSVFPESHGWEHTGSIDPRWVSPRGSTWNTPAATPRSGSPIAADFQFSTQSFAGKLPLTASIIQELGRSNSLPKWAGERGGLSMGPPAIPQSAPADR